MIYQESKKKNFLRASQNPNNTTTTATATTTAVTEAPTISRNKETLLDTTNGKFLNCFVKIYFWFENVCFCHSN
jgi:hypothetical protein